MLFVTGRAWAGVQGQQACDQAACVLTSNSKGWQMAVSTTVPGAGGRQQLGVNARDTRQAGCSWPTPHVVHTPNASERKCCSPGSTLPERSLFCWSWGRGNRRVWCRFCTTTNVMGGASAGEAGCGDGVRPGRRAPKHIPQRFTPHCLCNHTHTHNTRRCTARLGHSCQGLTLRAWVAHLLARLAHGAVLALRARQRRGHARQQAGRHNGRTSRSRAACAVGPPSPWPTPLRSRSKLP